MRLVPLCLALLLASGPLPAQSAAPISAMALKIRLFALAHDSMGGRATGSEGGFKAADYIASEFKRVGLEPAGDNGTYFQAIPFSRYQPDRRGEIVVGGARFGVGQDVIPMLAPGLGRSIAGAQVIAGGALDDTTTWISAEQARGKVVILTPPAEIGRRIGPALAGPRRSRRFADAALIAVPMLDQLGSEVVAAMTAGRVMLDTARTAQGPLLALVTARAAAAMLGRPLEGATPGTMGVTVSGSVGLGFVPLAYPARNVVGILRGADPARNRTYVSLSAHSDHVGFDRAPVDHDSLRAYNRVIRPMGADSPSRAATPAEWTEIHRILDSLRAIRPARPDSIRNGADDDGTGTVALLEVAESFRRGPAPARSILFVSHAAEEEGLLGSAWFTDHATVPIDSIVSEVDMDMIGRGSATDLPDAGPGYLEMIGLTRLSKEYGAILDRVNARQPNPFAFNLAFDVPGHPLQYYCRADHYNYARYGIPSVSLSRGEHLDYHQVTDEPQYIDYDALARVATFAADVAREVAGLDHRPQLDRPKGDPKAACVQ